MHKKCAPHYHQIVLPSGRRMRTDEDCFRNNPNFAEDEELGIFPLLAALAPAAISAGASLLGGGGGGKKGPTAAPVAPALAPDNTAAILAAIQSADRGANTSEVSNIVRQLLSEVPPPVRQQVSDALREAKLQNTDIKETMTNIVSSIGKEMAPALNQAIALLKEKQLQGEATNEHRILVKNDKRWESNTANQRRILQRLDTLEQRIGTEIRARRNQTIRTAAAFGVPSKGL